MRIIIITFLFMLISACATTADDKNPQSWNGKPVSLLIQRWGNPDKLIKTATGSSYYAYSTESYKSYPQPPALPYVVSVGKNNKPVLAQQPVSSKSPSLECLIVFTVDKQGIIVSSRSNGNSCH